MNMAICHALLLLHEKTGIARYRELAESVIHDDEVCVRQRSELYLRLYRLIHIVEPRLISSIFNIVGFPPLLGVTIRWMRIVSIRALSVRVGIILVIVI
jgi:hypothetical protein